MYCMHCFLLRPINTQHLFSPNLPKIHTSNHIVHNGKLVFGRCTLGFKATNKTTTLLLIQVLKGCQCWKAVIRQHINEQQCFHRWRLECVQRLRHNVGSCCNLAQFSHTCIWLKIFTLLVCVMPSLRERHFVVQ